jgi:CMP-N-acetylneuraminic acid synthetase
MRVAIIPACGDSKRMPRKNIKEFIVKSIIAWVNLAAQKSDLWLIK